LYGEVFFLLQKYTKFVCRPLRELCPDPLEKLTVLPTVFSWITVEGQGGGDQGIAREGVREKEAKEGGAKS